MKILFVDDSGIMRKSMTNAAKENGFTVIEAENGAEALSRLRKYGKNIDLVIMDWNMPIMDGYEALTRIKASQEYADIPVLMATADGVEEDVVKAIKAGASGYLVKPFTSEALLDQIKSILGSKYKPVDKLSSGV